MKEFSKRLAIVYILFFIFGAVIGWRLFNLQVLHSDYYQDQLRAQATPRLPSVASRKEVYIQDKEGELYPLAVNEEINSVYVFKDKLRKGDVQEVAKELSRIFASSSEDKIRSVISSSTGRVLIKRDISQKKFDQVQKKKLPATRAISKVVRSYPQKKLAARTIGFLGYEGDKRKGQYGIEAYYDSFLRAGRNESNSRLVLNLDYNIQFKARQVLKNAVEKYGASQGSVIVMNPHNGKLIALANVPSFNPNSYHEVSNYQLFLNPAVSSLFEPGSVLKSITMAGGLEEGAVKPDTTFYDGGSVEVGNRVIHNARRKAYQKSSMVKVLVESINTGAVYVQQQLGQTKFLDYIQKFGFGKKTGVDLAYEQVGNISNLFTKRPVNFATASFGQGISVTPIEMINAISAIANGGKHLTPSVRDCDRTKLKEGGGNGKSEAERVISRETASQLTSMLVEVVERGHGVHTKMDSYYVAGKTGTAQIPKQDSPGYSEKTTHAFVGYAPAYDPRFVMMVKLKNPTEARFSASSATPTFKKIARYILNYYEVPPTK